ncbi:arylsulfatase A-like enzyme [Lewinella marina]|nr:sulfatase [Neolewinella marina]NJB85412.1 arylsulfatase A-like enzyme [Neolewinella marina]
MARITQLTGCLLILLSCAASVPTGGTIAATEVITAQIPRDSTPNVLLIMIDDMNDWVKAYGGNPQAITPNIDRFAARAVRFDNAYCSAPLCNPSRTSLLTGYSPLKTGVYGNSTHFRDVAGLKDVVTLPQYFAANGYATFAAGKIFHSPRGPSGKPRPGSDPGSFQEEWRGGLGVPFPAEEDRFRALGKGSVKTPKNLDWAPIAIADENTNDWQIADYGAQVLAREHDKPFFLACGIFRPHLPWYAPEKYFNLYDADTLQLPEVIANDLADVPVLGQRMAKQEAHEMIIKQGKWKEAMRGYLASLSYADACAGHLLDALENSKYADNTIVVLMGDHGWNLGEKRHWSKNALWEESAKTPLIIFDPARPEPIVTDRVVSLLDLYPTLIGLSGLPPKEDLDGTDLSRFLLDPTADTPGFALTTKDEGNHSLRTDRYRYTRYRDGGEELYDHQSDPMEWKNLADDPAAAEVLDRLRKQLDRYTATLTPN